MAYVKGSGRVLREPEVFAIYDDDGRRTYIEVPAGTRIRLNATKLPEPPPLSFELTAACANRQNDDSRREGVGGCRTGAAKRGNPGRAASVNAPLS